jgi:tRNA A37 threonylcarbamoyladenosine modification protein TsaB
MQLSCSAELIGYASICAMACDAEEYVVIGDARRKSFFFARVLKNNLIEGPTLFSELELATKLEALDSELPICSSELLPQFRQSMIRFPSSVILAGLAQHSARSFCLPPLEPIYLREPHITIPK